MIKKIFVALVITVVLGVGVFGFVKSTFAQDITTEETEVTTEETTCEPVLMRQQLSNSEFETRECTGDCDDMLQTQTRTQMGPYGGNDGVCPNLEDGVCPEEKLQTRQQLGLTNGAGTMQRSNLQLNADGTCTGECDDMTQTQSRTQTGTAGSGFGMQRSGRGK